MTTPLHVIGVIDYVTKCYVTLQFKITLNDSKFDNTVN